MSCLYYNICERILQTHHKIRCERNEEFIPKTSNSNVFTNAFYRKELHLNYYFVICHVYRNKSNISIIALMFYSIFTRARIILDFTNENKLFDADIISMK